MGFLRFLLAFAVFNAHAGLPIGFSIVAGSTAVQCFFLISGFYMAMILEEKYGPSGLTYYDFISSHLLRLGPTYLAVLVLTLLFLSIAFFVRLPAAPPLRITQNLIESGANVSVLILSVVTQFSLLGLDTTSFLSWTPSAGLKLVSNMDAAAAGLYNLLLVPPAWSLSVEIYFYMLAPWFARLGTSILIALIVLSFLCRAFLALHLGYVTDPWSYRFFPSELAFFLTGMFAYRTGGRGKRRQNTTIVALLILGASLGATEIWGIWQPDMPVRHWARIPLFALLTAIMPALFCATKAWRLDRFVGELSYPLYVSHFLVIWAFGYAFQDSTTISAGVTVVCAAIFVAMAIRRCINEPVDRFRQARLLVRSNARSAKIDGKPHRPLLEAPPAAGTGI